MEKRFGYAVEECSESDGSARVRRFGGDKDSRHKLWCAAVGGDEEDVIPIL